MCAIMYIERKFKFKGVIMKLFSLDKVQTDIKFIKTGIPVFDSYYRGAPVGKLVSIFGAEDAGKSTLGWYWIVAFQTAFPEKNILFLDYEKKLDPNYLKIIGVDFERFLYADVNTIEEGLELARARMKKENDLSLLTLSLVQAQTKKSVGTLKMLMLV